MPASGAVRHARVSACFAKVIQWIQSLRAMGVMSDHNACATSRRFPACVRGEFEACLEEERI